MRKVRSLGFVLPAFFLLTGTYLLHVSRAHSQLYLDAFLIAGAAFSAIGLVTGFWTIQRRLSIRRLEQHARGHHQVEPR